MLKKIYTTETKACDDFNQGYFLSEENINISKYPLVERLLIKYRKESGNQVSSNWFGFGIATLSWNPL